MKAFFAKVWSLIKRFLHIGREVIEEQLEETKEELIERLEAELAQLEKEIEGAAGEALELLQSKAALIKS